MFRIMLVDDHPTMRMGLRLLLGQQPQLSLVGEANSAEEALPQIDALRPDVVVVDCQLPQQSGIALVSTLRARNHPTRLLALSAYDDEHYVRGMIAAGASGYLTKEDAPHNIVSAVLAVAEYVVRNSDGALEIDYDDGITYQIQVVKIGQRHPDGARYGLHPGGVIVGYE